MKKRIAIFGGSFSPIHNGHIKLGETILKEISEIEKVLFVVSPQNPLKDPKILLPFQTRVSIATEALQDYPGLEVSTIEDTLSKPSYMINTLDHLKNQNPILIIGGDCWNNIEKWKDYKRIVQDYGVVVYTRPGIVLEEKPGLRPLYVIQSSMKDDISSSMIRERVKNHSSIKNLVPDNIIEKVVSALS